MLLVSERVDEADRKKAAILGCAMVDLDGLEARVTEFLGSPGDPSVPETPPAVIRRRYWRRPVSAA